MLQDLCRNLSRGRHALLQWACSHPALRVTDDVSIHHLSDPNCSSSRTNNWFSVLIFKKTSSQDVQYLLCIREGRVLTTSGARFDRSGQMELCPHAIACEDAPLSCVYRESLSDRIFRTSFCHFPSTLLTDSSSGRRPVNNGSIPNPSSFRHWSYATRSAQMTTMHHAVPFLAPNNNLPNLTLRDA